LTAETLLIGLPTAFPTGYLTLDSLRNVALVIGLAAISAGHHRRRQAQLIGYLFLSLLVLACILTTYQANLLGNPPVSLALAVGGRLLLSFFTAIFAWSFFFSLSPPLNLVGRAVRGVLVAAPILQLLARTLFALQYAQLHMTVASFFFAGSLLDGLLLFAECVLLVAGLALFTQVVELMPTPRPAIIGYGTTSRTLFLATLVAAVLVTATTAIALVGRILPVFLPEPETMLALHTIAAGLVLGVVIVLITVGAAAFAMTRLILRPLDELGNEVAAVTQPGLTAYQEPRHLVFTELQSLSDGYRQLLDVLKRTRSQLRAPDPFARRESATEVPASRDDFYTAVLDHQAARASEVILRNLQRLAQTPDETGEMGKNLKEAIAATEELQEVLRVIQTLRTVDAGEIPELSSRDLGNILRQVVEETKEGFGHRILRISLQLSEPHCRILANDLATDVFTNILRCIVRNDVNEEVVIDLAVNQVQELDTTYWQTVITSHGWIVPDEQKDTMYLRDPRQAHTAQLSLLLAKALVEALHGVLRTGNEVPYDPRYGTAFAILLPAVMQDQPFRVHLKSNIERGS
jgi:hypothetical protein